MALMGFPKATVAKVNTLLDLSISMMQAQMWNRVGGVVTAMPMRAGTPIPPMTDEEKQLYDGLMAELGPQVQTQAEELIKTEMRDMMLLGGNWERVKAHLKAGKKPKLVRKREGPRDPLFLQFGNGVEDEIEEFRVLG